MRLRLEAWATGAWLGLTQVAIGFALMTGAGGSAALFFALVAAWIGGGAAGAVWARPKRGTILLAAAVALAVAARFCLTTWPFALAPIVVGLGAGLAAGAYAGVFLRDRALLWGDVRRLLLHENNGFLLGYAVGGVLILLAAPALDVGAPALGLVLVITRVVRRT